MDESIKKVSDEKDYLERVEENVEDEPREVQQTDDEVGMELRPEAEIDVPEWTEFSRGKRMVMMARTGKTIQALKKQCCKARMSACRAAKNVSAQVKLWRWI